MVEPTLNYLPCADASGGHRMAYWQWGNAAASHTLVCAHGLTRQGRDFDVLARSMIARSAQPLQVICPDVVGRGQSDWLIDPMAYQMGTYAADMFALLAHLQPAKLDWVGTSMGGLIGMAIAAHARSQGLAVRKLVLNDVGPVIQWDAIQRIAAYVGKAPPFASLEQAAAAMWALSASFGPHTPEQWLELSRHMVKPQPGGGVVLHYDPAIAVPFAAMTEASVTQGEALVWQLYDSIPSQTMLLRGASSDLLSRQTALDMLQRGPKARLVEFPGVGHAPTLIANDQVQCVADFLLQ